MTTLEELNGKVQTNVFDGESWERQLHDNMTEADVYLYKLGVLNEQE